MRTPIELIEKYNVPGPRYTSFPPVPFWQGAPSEAQWLEQLREAYDPHRGVDLYLHVPFCESLCYYCGCHRIITKSHEQDGAFAASLAREWALYQDKLGEELKVNSLHLGGGTPTFLLPEVLDELLTELLLHARAEFVGSIEIDPRTIRPGHFTVIQKHRLKRVSLGIQDFDPDVQTAIHRHQSVALIEAVVEKLRRSGVESINFDLIYGLPRQTPQTILETLQQVARLRPDMIAFYSYAHLPERLKNQRLIKESELPSPAVKRELYESGKELLEEYGYQDVGMDHFALPDHFLTRAQTQGRLKRNFMGYVDQKSNVLLGLGPSSISDSSVSFAQNIKDWRQYQACVQADRLPIEHGHVHTPEDLVVQDLIQTLMCQNEIPLAPLSMLSAAPVILEDLQRFVQDGLIRPTPESYQLTELGKVFMRNIAMGLDHHLRRSRERARFSQTI